MSPAEGWATLSPASGESEWVWLRVNLKKWSSNQKNLLHPQVSQVQGTSLRPQQLQGTGPRRTARRAGSELPGCGAGRAAAPLLCPPRPKSLNF